MIDQESMDATVARYEEAKAAKGENPVAGLKFKLGAKIPPGIEWHLGKQVSDIDFVFNAEQAIKELESAIYIIKSGLLSFNGMTKASDYLIKAGK